jgi:hypothetical protein
MAGRRRGDIAESVAAEEAFDCKGDPALFELGQELVGNDDSTGFLGE